MDFLEFTKNLNEIAKNYNQEPTPITEEDTIIAIAYINNILIQDIGDCLIFLTALNLCNSYVKQTNAKISYHFKKGIEHFLNIVNNQHIEYLKINKASDKGSLYIFQIGHIQFSFHDEKKVPINESYQSDLSWDGIRKQCVAKILFEYSIQNKIRVTNKSIKGTSLQEEINKIKENYQNNNENKDELMIIKI